MDENEENDENRNISQIDQDGEKLDIKEDTNLEQEEFQKYLKKESKDLIKHDVKLPETTPKEEEVIFWFKYLQEDKLTSSHFLQEQI